MYDIFTPEILFLFLLSIFSMWLYQNFFVQDVDVKTFNKLQLDNNCKQYLSTLKTKNTFHYNLMISSICTLILGTIVLLLQMGSNIYLSIPNFFIFCILVMVTTFSVSYKIHNCMLSRNIFGGGNCFYE